MFWRASRKTREAEIQETLSRTASEIVEILKEKWKYFNTALPFKEEISLSQKIEAFIVPAREGLLHNYPIMKSAPNAMIWEMIFVAVIESIDTHTRRGQ